MRAFGLPVLLVTLVLGGMIFVMQNRAGSATSPAQVKQDETQAFQAAAATQFGQVTQVLDAGFAASGTYVGAQLPAGSGVQLARAWQTGYCVQSTLDGAVWHETGPGGTPAPGACG